MRADLTDKSFVESLVSCKILKYEVKNGCEDGDNVAGSLKKLTIVTSEGQKLDVIFKIIPLPAPEWIIFGKVFRREHGVYRTLVSILRDFARTKGLKDYEPPLPKYYSGFNDDKDDYVCLQDLRPLGYTMPDKRETLNVNEMSHILRELARFHAISYAMIQERGETLFESEDLSYMQLPDVPHPDAFDDLIQSYFEVSTEIMESRNAEIGKRLKAISNNAWNIRRRTEVNKDYFTTIIHYDLWTNNLLIKYDEKTGEPVEVKFIDFQFAQKGNIFADLQYLILTSTTPNFRKSHLLTILGHYYDAFSETLASINCPLPIGFTRGFLIDEFYKCFLPGFVHMTFAIALQLGDIVSTMASRNEKPEEEGPPCDPDPKILAKKFYLGSPLALHRLESLAQELIDLKFL